MTNTIKAAAEKIREAQLANRVSIMSELKMVASGDCKFATLTRDKAQHAGVSIEIVASVAARMGLSVYRHGPYVAQFSRAA